MGLKVRDKWRVVFIFTLTFILFISFVCSTFAARVFRKSSALSYSVPPTLYNTGALPSPQSSYSVRPSTPSLMSGAISRGVIFFVSRGSLKRNLAMFLNSYGWRTPAGEWWRARVDYMVGEGFTVKGKDIFDAVNQLLEPYPLKAEFYLKDNTVRIVPINMKAVR